MGGGFRGPLPSLSVLIVPPTPCRLWGPFPGGPSVPSLSSGGVQRPRWLPARCSATCHGSLQERRSSPHVREVLGGGARSAGSARRSRCRLSGYCVSGLQFHRHDNPHASSREPRPVREGERSQLLTREDAALPLPRVLGAMCTSARARLLGALLPAWGLSEAGPPARVLPAQGCPLRKGHAAMAGVICAALPLPAAPCLQGAVRNPWLQA